jgi:hypothetical protein
MAMIASHQREYNRHVSAKYLRENCNTAQLEAQLQVLRSRVRHHHCREQALKS